MAGAPGPAAMKSLWPRLRRRVKEGKKEGRKENPYASTGLDRFAILVEELQAKRLAMVDKTAMSVSAVRSLSKSAQEWTASTLFRTASKRRIELLSKAPPDVRNDFQVVQTESAKQGGEEMRQFKDISGTELFTKARDEHRNYQEAMDIDDTKQGQGIQQQDCAQESCAQEKEEEEAGASGCAANRDAEVGIPSESESREKSEIAELPLKMKRTMKTRRPLACVRDKAASKAAVAVLVAVGAFFASKRAELGKPVADAMSFSIVMRRWRNGKLYARFLFSAMASYLLSHLHSYLSVRAPKRLTFTSTGLQKVEDEQKEKDQEAKTVTMEQEQTSSSALPILPGSPSPPSPICSPATEIESSSPLPISPTTAKVSDKPSTDLGSKLSLKFKSRFVKSFHLSKVAPGNTPMNSPGRPTLPPPSGNKHIFAPGSPSTPLLETENSDSNTASSSSGQSEGWDAAPRPKGCKKFCFSRKPKASSESSKIVETRRQKLLQRLESNGKSIAAAAASDDVQRSFTTMVDVSSRGLRKIKTTRSVVLPTVVEERRESRMHSSSSSSSASSSLEGGEESCLLCGLIIVALLFLLAGRVPAILATSVFLLALSQVQKLRSSSRGQRQRRDQDVTTTTRTTRAPEPSRKLHVPGSPLSPFMRSDINSMEYRKRIIMEGLLERKNWKGNS